MRCSTDFGVIELDSNVEPVMAPWEMPLVIWRHRALIRVLATREIIGRYRGSVLGLLWSFFNPLLMLVVYTFVFSMVFRSRWGGGGGVAI